MAQVAAAEPRAPYFYVAPLGGFTKFDHALRYSPAHRLTSTFDVGACAGIQLTRRFGIEASGGITPTYEDSGGVNVNFFHAAGHLTYTPFSGRTAAPFIMLGAGASQLSLPGGIGKLLQGNLDLGLGLQLWLSDVVGMRFEAHDLAWLPKDHPAHPSASTVVLNAGVSFAMTSPHRDGDGDGVTDTKDRCPDTPRGAIVDATGCPTDSDGDGVYDGIDQCAGTPRGASVDAKGCPHDSDRDGVLDGLDQCADTPAGASVDAKGCPKDSDGDGVPDGIDRCSNTPQGASVDSLGCTKDSDGDGIPDGIDKCPDTRKGTRVNKDGCPAEVIERETELLESGIIRLLDLPFEPGRATLAPAAQPTLDVIGQVLSKWTDLRIEIGVFTDSPGSEALNKNLSQDRAAGVLEHLLTHYPDLRREQYTTRGYGKVKTRGVPPNTPAVSKRPRVEFKVLNPEVLKREIERRKLLKSSE